MIFDKVYNQLLLERIYGNIGWVFHRTRSNPEESLLRKKGIQPNMNKLATYGKGLYNTYSLESQLNNAMKSAYGSYIVKGKVNLENVVILDRPIFEITYPNKDFSDYLKSIGLDSKQVEENKYTSDIAQKFWKKWKQQGYKGIIFTGRTDGKVAVLWKRSTYIPYSYSNDDGETWKKLNPDIKTITDPKIKEGDIDTEVGTKVKSPFEKRDKKNILKVSKDEHDNIKIKEFTPEDILVSIFQRDSSGYWEWQEYDSNGNQIHYKDSGGFEYWQEYDSNDKMIHYKDSDGFEWLKEYDSNGNQIYYKDFDGKEWWKEFDSNGNQIHYKHSDGKEWWKEYDSNGNQIHYKGSGGFEYWEEYDSNDKMIHYKDSDGEEYWYDSNGNQISKEEFIKLYGDTKNNSNKKISNESFIFDKIYKKLLTNFI